MGLQMLPDQFRAAVVESFGDPSVLTVAMQALPSPRADEVLVEVHAASVTPLDTYLRNGVKIGNYTPDLPYTPGAALSGIVAAVGANEKRLEPGDRVYGRAFSGSNAEYALCHAAQLYALPPHIGFVEGALIAVPYETAYYSLVDLADGREGESVLVQGAAGAVGAATVQIAKSMGMTVIATCSQRDAEAVGANGADHVFDYHTSYAEAVMTLTGGRGVDVIIEVAAKTNLAMDMRLAAPGGRIVIVGGTGDTPFNALLVIAKGLKILGVDLRAMSPARVSQVNMAIVAGLRSGILKPAAANHFPLEKIAEAHAAVEAGKGSGGVVLNIRSR